MDSRSPHLRGIRSTLFADSAIYLSANVLKAAVPFLLLPIITAYLLPSDYGVFAIYSVLVNLVVPFSGLSIARAISRAYVDRDEIDVATYVTSNLALVCASTFVVLLVMLAFANPIGRVSTFPARWLWIPVIASLGQTVLGVVLVLFQMKSQPARYGAFAALHSLVGGALTLWFVVGLSWGWRGTVVGHAMGLVLVIPIALAVLWLGGELVPKLSVRYMRHAFSYGAPLIPHVIGTVIVTMTDRIFLAQLVGLSAAGIYAAGYQIGMVMFLLITSINQAWIPWLFPRLKAADQAVRHQIVKLTYSYYAALLVLAATIAVASPWFTTVYLDEPYAEAGGVLPWLVAGFAVRGMTIMKGNYLYFAGKTGILSVVTVVATVVNVVMNLVLIPINGAAGAAQASLVAFLLALILTWIAAAKAVSMPWFLLTKRPAS